MKNLYKFIWKNKYDKLGNETKRNELYNRTCKIIKYGRMRSVKVMFIDNGQIEIVDKYSLKYVGNKTDI